MYIRTKDGVYELVDNLYQYHNGVEKFWYAKEENGKTLAIEITADKILNQSENLFELFDEYCYIKDGVVSQYLTIDFKFKRDDEFCALRNKLTANGIAEISKGISKYELENGELKFAIWTDWGLKYVAKMDSEGKLVLI